MFIGTLPLITLSKHSQRKFIKLFGACLRNFLKLLLGSSSICFPSARTHDIHAKSTQDLGFPRYQFQVHARSWILQEPHEGFQDLGRNLRGFPSFTFFTIASFLSQNYSQRQNFGSIALDNSQNLEKKHFFSSPQQHFQDLDRILTRFCVVSQDFDFPYFRQNGAL